MPWFQVRSLAGPTVSAEGLAPELPVLVMFLCAHSPYVIAIQDHLGRTISPRAGRDLNVVAIASNDQRAYPSDSDNRLREQMCHAKFGFDYCVDDMQQAARAFGASCTPEFYVFDRDRRLTYHGQYDDARPGPDCMPTGTSLLEAVDAVVADAILEADQQPSFGCSIKWRAGAEPSYVLAP
jgi:hypothetical protein